jgi:hypothetical protein
MKFTIKLHAFSEWIKIWYKKFNSEFNFFIKSIKKGEFFYKLTFLLTNKSPFTFQKTWFWKSLD